MPTYKYTLESAFIANKEDKLCAWLIDFLVKEGNNPKLAKILQDEKPNWIGLVEYDLNKLKRVMGPEPEMVFHESEEAWQQRINKFVELISNGLKPCPIIASDYWNEILICDGTHRFEALKKVGITKYWTIFFLRNIRNKDVIFNIK
jgi:hypothetical protein